MPGISWSSSNFWSSTLRLFIAVSALPRLGGGGAGRSRLRLRRELPVGDVGIHVSDADIGICVSDSDVGVSVDVSS